MCQNNVKNNNRREKEVAKGINMRLDADTDLSSASSRHPSDLEQSECLEIDNIKLPNFETSMNSASSPGMYTKR